MADTGDGRDVSMGKEGEEGKQEPSLPTNWEELKTCLKNLPNGCDLEETEAHELIEKLKGAYKRRFGRFQFLDEEGLKALALDPSERSALKSYLQATKKSSTPVDWSKEPLPDYTTEYGHSSTTVPSVPRNHPSVELHLEKTYTLEDLPTPVLYSRVHDEARGKYLDFASENDVAGHIKSVLFDIIKAADLQLKLHSEQSVVKELRPDFLVLRSESRFPVGVIEVKKPGKKDLVTEPKIFGELYDYLMFMKSTYNLSSTFGILTSYSQWFVCSLEPFSEHKSPPLRSSSPSRQMEYFDCSSQMEVDSNSDKPDNQTDIQTDEKQKNRKKETPSQALGLDVFQVASVTNIEKATKEVPKIYYSRCFNYNDPDVWRMAFTSLMQMNGVQTKHDGQYRFVAVVGPEKDGYSWRTLSKPVKLSDMNFENPPHANTIKFFVWENLGAGLSGKALLVSSKEKLKMGVLKCFFSGTEKTDDKEAARLKKRDEEMAWWKNIYGENGHRYNYRAVRACGRPSIVMNYFATVPKSLRTSSLLGKVEKALRKDFDNRGFVNSDVAWRNLGLDKNGAVVFFDLGNVRRKNKGEGVAWIREAMGRLEG